MSAAPPSSHPDPASLLYALPSILDRLDLARVFAESRPLEVELGCGDASFLLEYARQNPQRNFLGVERLLGRIRKLDRKGRRLGLANLRGVRLEASYFLEYLLPAASVEALHVYFPDPWPKAKHQSRRLVNPRFPRLALQALAPGGWVYLRTDDPPYFEQMQEIFATQSGFIPGPTPPALAELVTDFEREFLAAGKPTLRAAYRACISSSISSASSGMSAMRSSTP
jgi:tRNA (guanine-N7-)-methyltransferase